MTKPTFTEGDRVSVALPTDELRGTIRGLASENIIDLWIVEIDEDDRTTLTKQGYFFSCIAAPGSILTHLFPLTS